MVCTKYSFAPVIDKKSKVLILGSLPGMRSLMDNEYYANAHNSFWKIMFCVFERPFSFDYSLKLRLLTDNGIALWDVIKCAERAGSCDSNIKDAIPNEIPDLLNENPAISSVLFNGTFAFSGYKKFFGRPNLPYEVLLSTSPACAGREKEKTEMWKKTVRRAIRGEL